MNLLGKLIASFLTEALGPLTKGSQRVMSDPKLVSALAARVRRDADFNPSAFPHGADDKFDRAPDAEVAHWVLESLDKIEKLGYEGTIYSRDGLHSDWIVRNYINGKHNWEDLTGILNMNLRDWSILKTRGELDPKHDQISKFTGIRDLAAYMVHHYSEKLAAARDAAKNVARDKMARAIPLINNADYKIYVSLNRAAACKLGQGTTWCTTNSESGSLYNNYANAGMLYQLFPTTAAETNVHKGGRVITGKEKFQFGPDQSLSFMDIADNRVPDHLVAERFPYLYTDLVAALKKDKEKIEAITAELAEDPLLQDPSISKIKIYVVAEEIKKLKRFVDRGSMTELVRPKDAVEKDDSAQEQPQIAPAAKQPPEGNPMESIKQLAQSMLEEITLGHIVRQYKPADNAGEESPLTNGGELEEEDLAEYGDENDFDAEPAMPPDDNEEYYTQDSDGGLPQDADLSDPSGPGYDGQDDWDKGVGYGDQPEEKERSEQIHSIMNLQFYGSAKSGHTYREQELLNMQPDQLQKIYDEVTGNVSEEDEGLDVGADQGMPAATGGGGGSMAPMGGGGGGQYPPGTAPTMPESINNEGNNIMENVDQDVAAMLKSLKTYDKLVESCAPVIGMKTLNSKEVVKETDWGNLGAEYRDKKSSTGGTIKSSDSGLVHKAKPLTGKAPADKNPSKKPESGASGGNVHISRDDDKKMSSDDLEESVDQDILDWMNRFSKLGNMKGYGR